MAVAFNTKACPTKGRLFLAVSMIGVIGLISCQRALTPAADSDGDIDHIPSDSGGEPDSVADSEPVGPDAPHGLNAVYYDDMNLTDRVLERIDANVDFDWDLGAPDGVEPDAFSVRWTGAVLPETTERYRFTTESDDGVRLWINDRLIIDKWTDQAVTRHSGVIALAAGHLYSIKLEYYDNTEHAVNRLYWESSSQPRQVVPPSRLLAMDPPPPPGPEPDIEPEPGGALWMVNFKIKHSDATLLVFPDGQTMMIDTSRSGTCEEEIVPFLRHYGIDRLDYVIVTHAHGDHSGGFDVLKELGFIDDDTVQHDCRSLRIGDTFDISGAHFHIYNASRGGCGNEDSVSYFMFYNGFVVSGSGDEHSFSMGEVLEEHPEFFPAHVRYINHHCVGKWHHDFLRALNAYIYICPTKEEGGDYLDTGETWRRAKEIMMAVPRFQKIVFQDYIHVIRATSGEDWDSFRCDDIESCPVEFPVKQH